MLVFTASRQVWETLHSQKSHFTTAYFWGLLYIDSRLSPKYEFVLLWHDVDCDPCHPDLSLYVTCDTCSWSHFHVYHTHTLRIHCYNKLHPKRLIQGFLLFARNLLNMYQTKDPLEGFWLFATYTPTLVTQKTHTRGFDCLQGTCIEQKTHSKGFNCLLPANIALLLAYYCAATIVWYPLSHKLHPSRSPPPRRRTRTQSGLTWHNHPHTNLFPNNHSILTWRGLSCATGSAGGGGDNPRDTTTPALFGFRTTTALITWREWGGTTGSAGAGGGNALLRKAVEAHLGALFRGLNTDRLASNTCAKCGTSCSKEDRATQPFWDWSYPCHSTYNSSTPVWYRALQMHLIS